MHMYFVSVLVVFMHQERIQSMQVQNHFFDAYLLRLQLHFKVYLQAVRLSCFRREVDVAIEAVLVLVLLSLG
jgi:hypothetical protein